MKNIITLLIGMAIGATIAVAVVSRQSSLSMFNGQDMETEEDQPLYWVAPMDPNFRKAQPGKSPMGMDLVPVYSQGQDNNTQDGMVYISPNVVNNLGVRTALVEQKTMHIPINTVGYVQYNQDKLVHIHPRVEGWIDKLYVKAAGQLVEKNQALYALYSPQLVNAQEEYLLATNRSNTALIGAAEARLMALQMPIKAIEQLKKNKKVQQTIEFKAPQSGVVDNLNIRQGFYVKPGTTLMSIGALDEVWVEAEIFERQASLVKTDLPVTMTLGYIPGRIWQGKLDYVYPILDPTNRTVRVRLRFDNQDRLLKPNMFAQVTIHSDLNEDSLLVPRQSVISTGHQDRVVMALDAGRFKSVEVVLGLMTSDYAQILSGLELGDRVVTSAQFLLDSESSINSDFLRMSHSEQAVEKDPEPVSANRPTMRMSSEPADKEEHSTQSQESVFAIVDGVINSVDLQGRFLNISRAAIEKWQRPAATLDFAVAESVNLEIFRVGDSIRFTFEISDGEFVVVSAQFVATEKMRDKLSRQKSVSPDNRRP
jgi:Cu(I)/Ag(I) efflux system membrane fusion protein